MPRLSTSLCMLSSVPGVLPFLRNLTGAFILTQIMSFLEKFYAIKISNGLSGEDRSSSQNQMKLNLFDDNTLSNTLTHLLSQVCA